MKQISRIPSASFLLVGALCIFFPSHVAGVLPFLLGGIMLIAGIVHGAAYLRDKRFLEDEPQGIGRTSSWRSWASRFCARAPRPWG